MRKRGWMAVAVGLALFGGPTHKAEAQFLGVGNATEWTQLLNNAQLVMSYVKQAQTALHSVQMAQMMVREGQQLVQHPTTNIAADLLSLSSILQQSQGLAGNLAQMDAQFRSVYAPFSASPIASYAGAYNQWAMTTLNTIHGATNTAGFQGNMIGNEQAFMAKIKVMLQTPAGQDQALQLGNVLGTETVAQLQKLRQLMMADMAAKGAIAAQLVNTQQVQQNAQQNGFRHAVITADQRAW